MEINNHQFSGGKVEKILTVKYDSEGNYETNFL